MASVTVSDDTWRTANFRQNLALKIEETIQKSGLILSKNAVEFEGYVFSSAKSKKEYLSSVTRMIIDMKEMECRNRMEAREGQSDLPGRIVHCNGLFKDLRELWKSQECSDIVFQCHGGQMTAHKLIVSARSEVFRSMFRSSMIESTSNIVEIDDIKLVTMHILLEYMYTGCVGPLSTEELTELLRAADKYQMNELKNACFELLIAQLKIINAGELAVLAYFHNAEDKIKIKIHDYIIRMREELGKVSEFKLIVEANPMVFQGIMFETYNQ